VNTLEFVIDGIKFTIIPVQSTELFYVISTQDAIFTAAFDNEKLRLAVDRPAPYIAYEYEIPLADRIQAFNDNLYVL
jgi:hypothetical protein